MLEGAADTLRRHRPLCVVEFNSYTMVYHQGAAPRDFLDFLYALFPRLYHFDRTTYELTDLAGRADEFLKINQANGFVDDLVGAFDPLPARRN